MSKSNLFTSLQNTKALMGQIGVWAIDEYDEVGLHLQPDQEKNPDSDKVIKDHPGFDPVFMKV